MSTIWVYELFIKSTKLLLGALCYKQDCRLFDSRWGYWIFCFNLPNPSSRTNGPGVDSARNRNEYQKFSRRSKARPERKDDNLTDICEVIV
jgi:hypothetical protein